MLINFKVSNFLSFQDTQEFDLKAGTMKVMKDHLFTHDKDSYLKFASIYGANASGKSNFIRAIDFVRSLVQDQFKSNATNMYHKSCDDNKTRESLFEFTFIIRGNIYQYGFKIVLNELRIIEEWLHDKTLKRDVFRRPLSRSFTIDEKKFKASSMNRLKIYLGDIKSDSSILFLTVMNQNKDSLYKDHADLRIFSTIYNWLTNKIKISYPHDPISSYSYFGVSDNLDEIKTLIKSFGTSITDFRIIGVPIEEVYLNIPSDIIESMHKNLINRQLQNADVSSVAIRSYNKDFYLMNLDENNNLACQTLEFTHENCDVGFSLSEESDGTVRLLDLIEVLLDKDSGSTYIIDELDRSLHPLLTYKFVKRFKKIMKDRNVQLIITTHESRLLDFKLLRRDEIWFIDKNSYGQSIIDSLESYNERTDKKIDKAYLEGKYNGVPVFDTLFDFDDNEDNSN